MNSIIFFILILVAGFVWRLIVAAGAAGAKSLTSGGKFGEQFKARAFGMGPFEIRTRRVEPSGDRHFVSFEVEGRGLFPVQRATEVSIVTSLLDVTEADNPRPVLSMVDAFQEPATPAFQFAMQPSVIQPNHGLVEWCRIGVVIPDVLKPPRGGRRRLDVWVNLVDAHYPAEIQLGFVSPESPSPVSSFRQSIEWDFGDRGYEEEADNRKRQRPLFIRLAVVLAMADGSLGETEATTISTWIKRQLSVQSDARKEEMKQICNGALREAYAEAKAGTLSFSGICQDIIAVSDVADRYEAIELCLDVMAADGKAEASELDMIRRVAATLELDFAELEKMKDQRMVGVTLQVSESSTDGSLESALGIDPSWPPERINIYLRDQFKTWNARLNAASSRDERSNMQAHLDLIAQARKKYAG
jgi:uncharacterized tellurite resistance protein B-like protein